MKKTRLQVAVEFLSQVRRLKSEKSETAKKKQKSSFKKLSLFALVILFANTNGFAATYYTRISGNWNANTSWSTVGYGNPTNTGTFPKTGDVANIGNGYTIYVTSNVDCATLNVGQGISGILQYQSASNYTVTIAGNVTINTGAKIWYNAAINRTHRLNVGANLSNFGTLDFFVAATQSVTLNFNTSSNSIVSGTGTWDLNLVTLAKSTSIAAQMNVQSSTFEAGIRTLTATYGTYIHNNNSTYNINPSAATYIISPNVVFQIPLGTMNFAYNADNLLLQGTLTVNGGTVNVGTSAGLQGIRSDKNGTFTPTLNVTSGNLFVYGGITSNSTSFAEPFNVLISGGTILLNSGSTGTNRQVFCVNDVAGSSFNMSNGTITIQKPNIAGSGVPDFTVCGTNGTVTSTGGLVKFGNASTPSGAVFNFKPAGNVILPHFRVSGQAGLPNTLSHSNGSTANTKLLSLYIETGKTFDIRSISGATGDNRSLTLLSTANGVDAIFNNGNFIARLSTVTFNTNGPQSIGGTSITTFYNLSINNSSNITLNKTANISNYLSMVSGKLITTNSNLLICGVNADASLGTNSSYVDGPMVHTISSVLSITKTYPIGKGTVYRAVVLTAQHSTAASVTYRSEIFNSAASSLPFTYPPSISAVSHVRYAKFTRQNVNNFVSGRIQMYYSIDDGVADKSTLAVAQDNGGTMWSNIAGTATANWNGSITSGVFATFNSYFALANPPGGGNPLPIQLASFSSHLLNKKVELKWTTQAEVNNDYFTVERSANNEIFTPIATINGSGTTSETHNYAFTDHQPLKGISYYRITQTDYDGQISYFNSSVVDNKISGAFAVFPNPAPTGHVNMSSEEHANYTSITVQDITGKIIPAEVIEKENGSYDIDIDERYSSKGGIFIISATDGPQVYRQKLIVR